MPTPAEEGTSSSSPDNKLANIPRLLDPRLQWRLLTVVRALLALACLGREIWAGSGFLSGEVFVAACFSLFGIGTAIWGDYGERSIALLGLFVDTLFFLAFATWGADWNTWLGTVFFVYLMLSAVTNHSLWDVLTVAAICIAFVTMVRTPQVNLLWRSILPTSMLASLLALQKEKLEEYSEETTRGEALRAAQTGQKVEEERARIANDLHDGPLQSFISFHMRLDILRKILERDKGAGMEELRQLFDLSKTQITELRAFLRHMRPAEPQEDNLVSALRRAVSDFQKDSGISSAFSSGDTQVAAPPEVCVDVLQIVRESLHNVRKHANATRVAVAVEKPGKLLEISVNDNGSGFPFSGAYTLDELERLRLGPISIERRVRGLNGDLTVESRPGRGAGLQIRIPL
jgi:signal transduction histidine kinase